ncbi:glycosyltransferase family 2 protein [Fulvivirga sp. RKSG066]|uniref:glycosyltransferase family 2 protein n=1 Tax=Fulvivirga aurantia TaxID=2529383 RepID=UPI0012BBB338|nr:glycosyltransferase family 2 protein [Fulvivirga aurantia]MTI20636.1 glycosyltransferase family 2 protein [Fulvivirga aurantia]
MVENIFWIGLGILIYTYLGYGAILFIMVKLKRIFNKRKAATYAFDELPELTLMIPCYNEEDFIEDKIKNCLELEYPAEKKHLVFVTDGSTDKTNEYIEKHEELELYFSPERRGKNAAVNRVMPHIKTPIVVFCDSNTMLNKDALVNIARHYKDPKVGGVAGEKRVASEGANAAGSGEGAYWKYESKLKQWDSELHSVVGAAGELFSIRTELYEEVPPNVIIEDFRLSMNIAKDGLRVVYEPDAYAVETGSASIDEENKRKVRISAGGLREVAHFSGLLNFFKHGLLTFQYVSHRMLRWTLAPLALPVVFVSNGILAFSGQPIYQTLFALQVAFYLFAALGHTLRNKAISFQKLFIPYYFVFMNLSVYKGLGRLLKGSQSVVWEKAQRAKG